MAKIYPDKRELIKQIVESLIDQHLNYHHHIVTVSKDVEDRKLAFILFCCLNV